MDQDDLSMLYTHISTSIHFTLPTIAILDLSKQVNTWITEGECGAIIYGRPRIGKTRAIMYISRELKKKYGTALPVYVLNMTDHKASEKYFYSEFLKAIGHKEVHKGTVSMLKERLINALIFDAQETQYRRVVLFIDEAFLLTEKDFIWLMDIHNNLDMQNVHLTVLLFGTSELKGIKTAFCRAKKYQIVDRLMLEEYLYQGISSSKDALACLHNLDIPLTNYHRPIILTQTFFPDAYDDKKRLASCADMLWDSFCELIESQNIADSDVPMKYFMKAIIYCLKTFGAFGKGIYFPNKANWEEAVLNSGYLKSISCTEC